MNITNTTWFLGTCPKCGHKTLETVQEYAVHLVAMGGMEIVYGQRSYVQCGNPVCDYADAYDPGI